MDFSLEDAPAAVADLAATVLRGEIDSPRVDQALAGEGGYDETLWKAMAQSGLLALALPEDLGGDGFGPIEVGLVLTEVGRQIAPVPALATLALGVLPVVALATPDQQARLLAGVADGAVLTGALRGSATSEQAGNEVRLSGQFAGVPYAAQARFILIGTESGLYPVDPAGAGVTLTRTPSSTGAPEYTVSLQGATVAGADRIAGTATDLERFALAGAAAVADGVAAGGLALTAAHLGSRHQFGKPLATFQAVAQELADVYIVARTVHLAATSAAWRLASGLDAEEDLQVAAYWLAANLPTALQHCHHLHGGLGVDRSYPMHRYYSHAKDLARFVGGAAYRLDRIGA